MNDSDGEEGEAIDDAEYIGFKFDNAKSAGNHITADFRENTITFCPFYADIS